MVRQLYLYSIEAADFPDSVTSENTLREFPLVIATVAKVSRKRGLWLVVRVNKKTAHVLLPCRQSEFCVLSVIYYVTVQYPHTYRNLPRSFPSDAWQVTSKNPFQIGFADGIFAFKPVFYYGQRSKCPDLLNSYLYSFYLFYFLYLRDLSLFSLTEKSGPGHSQILSQIKLPISVVPTCFMPSSMISTVR